MLDHSFIFYPSFRGSRSWFARRRDTEHLPETSTCRNLALHCSPSIHSRPKVTSRDRGQSSCWKQTTVQTETPFGRAEEKAGPGSNIGLAGANATNVLIGNRSTKSSRTHLRFAQALPAQLLRARMQGIFLHHCHRRRPGRACRRLHGLVRLPVPITPLQSCRVRAAGEHGDAGRCSRPCGQYARMHTRMLTTRLWRALGVRRKHPLHQ